MSWLTEHLGDTSVIDKQLEPLRQYFEQRPIEVGVCPECNCLLEDQDYQFTGSEAYAVEAAWATFEYVWKGPHKIKIFATLDFENYCHDCVYENY